ncbi:hypothetical protein M422DRAFT_238718 [Sphaerobolus stellatus SS14]|nr:hypothetical protein M422DRAFT_238718 [Sphaerobolus stellatus SS14]
MSHKRGITRRAWADELSAQAVDDGEPTPGLTMGNLANSPSPSADLQQRPEVLALEHPGEPYAQAYGAQTVPSWEQTSMNSMSPRMKELFLVPSKNVSGKTCEPGNILAHDKAAAKAATEQIINQMSMMEPAPGSGAEERMRTTQARVPGDQYSWSTTVLNILRNIQHTAHGEQSDDSQLRRGREVHTGYAHATCDARVTDQSSTRYTRDIRVTESTHMNSQESTCRRRNTYPINTRCELVSVNMRNRPRLSAEQVIPGVPESIEHSRHSIRDSQSIDMNALREEIKETISATIKEKLHSDADSVTTVSQSISALDANAQYWSDLSTKPARHSHRALELQLKLVEEKVNSLLHEEAPEEVLLEAAQEARNTCF